MTHDHRKVIAIDGPGAAGKTTVARHLAQQLDILLFDTGALYRAVTLAALRQGADLNNEQELARIAHEANIDLNPPSKEDGRMVDVHMDGDDITWAIREPIVDANVSQVSAYPAVRKALLDVQRRIADGAAVVMVGRDIGTIVTPDAGTKIYLDASVEERARRRYIDLRKQGADMDFAAVLDDLRERDFKDSSRATAPLRAAQDAERIITDGQSVDQIVVEIERLVRKNWDDEI